jgi:hypothetical protein
MVRLNFQKIKGKISKSTETICLKCLYTVPSIAEPVVRGIKGLLHPETNKIMSVYGTNRNVWLKVLKESIDLSELPPELGGTKYYKDIDFENEDVY